MDSYLVINIVVAMLSAFTGAILNETSNIFSDRRNHVNSVVERYILEIKDCRDTPTLRMGAMQMAGVALLSSNQVKKFCSEVVGRGYTPPFENSVIEEHVNPKKIPQFFRAATEHGINLSDDESTYRFLCKCVFDSEYKKTNDFLKRHTSDQ